MINPELKDYVKKCEEAGQTKDQIRESLLANGWENTDIDEAFGVNIPVAPVAPIRMNNVLENKTVMQDGEFQKRYPLSPKKFTKKMLPNFIGAFFLIIIPFFLIFFFSSDISSDLYSFFLRVLIYFIVLCVVVLFFYSWYYKTYIRKYYYDAGDNFITIRKGVFSISEIHVQYQKIQDVYVDQDLFDRILGLYDVHIASATYTSGLESHIDGVNKENAEAIKDYLLNKITHKSVYGNSVDNSKSNNASQGNLPSFSMTEHISSKEFPISSVWLLKSISFRVFYNLIIVFILMSKNSSDGFDFPVYVYLLIVIVLVVGNIIYAIIWRNNYYFEFTKDFILIRESVISNSEKHVPYSSIQDVIKNQSFFDRIVGLSNVIIQNATQGLNANIVIPGLKPAHAEKISDVARSIIQSRTNGTSYNGL